MTNEELLSVAEIVERATNRLHKQAADHETKMAEHRASFGARTEADAKLIAGLRDERDGLLTQVQDMRAEMERLKSQMAEQEVSVVGVINERNEAWDRCDALRADVAALQERLRASIFAQMEVAALKSQTPKHPVKVGEWLKRTKFEYSEGTRINTIAQVVGFDPDGDYLVSVAGSEHCWCPSNCTPCDPPTEATHDTPDGRSVAESVIRDDRNTEPVADEIKVGDMVRVVGASGDLTAQSDIGKIGEVLQLDSMDGAVRLSGGAGWVNHRDVRKVTT